MTTYILRQGKGNTGKIFGSGSASSPTPMNAVNSNGIGLWLKSSAASGDARAIYARLYLNGATGGEAVRAFATATTTDVATGGTMNGIHATAYVNTSSSISGAANAGRFTLGAAAASRTLSGALSSLQLDSDVGTGNTLPTIHGFLRVTDSGAVRLSNLAVVPAAANGTLFATHTTQAMTHSLRIIDAAGTAFYIMCTNAATNRG